MVPNISKAATHRAKTSRRLWIPHAEVQEAGIEQIAALCVSGELTWERAFPTLREAVLRVPQVPPRGRGRHWN